MHTMERLLLLWLWLLLWGWSIEIKVGLWGMLLRLLLLRICHSLRVMEMVMLWLDKRLWCILVL